jgi:hypothetical protein
VAAGSSTAVGGALTVSAGDGVLVSLEATTTQVGRLTVLGGTQVDIVDVAAAPGTAFATGPAGGPLGAVRLLLKGGDNSVDIGHPDGTATMGALTVQAGSGVDRVTLSSVEVEGKASINTGAGSDLMAITDGSTFGGTTFIGQGSGDDTLILGGGPGAVKFTGRLTARQGSGNDMVLPFTEGTADGQVSFAVTGNLFDGGPSLNDDKGGNADSANVTFINYEV